MIGSKRLCDYTVGLHSKVDFFRRTPVIASSFADLDEFALGGNCGPREMNAPNNTLY